METCDGILKFGHDGKGCQSCTHGIVKKCANWNSHESCSPDDEWGYYADHNQITEKIAEAESGAHKWVRENTLFVCDVEKCKQDSECAWKKPRNFMNFTCHLPGLPTKVLKPYRGTKGEDISWPGRPEVIKQMEIAARENATAEDCSEIEKEHKKICKDRSTAWGAQCASCPWGNLHDSYTDDFTCYEAEEWIEPFEKESEEMAEYVVIETIRLTSLSSKVSIDPAVFLWFFKNFHNAEGWEIRSGNTFDSKYISFEHADELLRLGFIEEKVDDIRLELGDYIVSDTNDLLRFIRINEGVYGLFDFKYSSVCVGYKYVDENKCKLSEIVGKACVKGFKPVDVEISVWDDILAHT